MRLFLAALLCAVQAPCLAAQDASAPPAPAPPPDELVLEGENIITVLLNGIPVRLEVSAEAFGPPIINPELAAQLQLVPMRRRGWLFGPVSVSGWTSVASMDLGAGERAMTVSWAAQPVSARADGMIGVHNLPHRRITFALGDPAEQEQVQILPLVRSGGSGNARVGTELRVGKKKLTMVFVTERAENLVTAPTANFIATHQEGGFEPGSEGRVLMNFGIERPIRMMRLAHPIELGDLLVDRFAVRVEDYGDPRQVGEIGENDPRFQKGQILVSRRKGKGRPDLLTRIGRKQIPHCSRLTYDFEAKEIRLSCTPASD